jgi:hypothetical protein
MRSATLLIVGILLVGVVFFYVLPALPTIDGAPTAPGQYPINASRWSWPVTERVAYYRPGASMGSDMVSFPGGNDAKGRCATSPTCVE